MIALDLNARFATRAISTALTSRILHLIAKAKRPARVPYDYREIERVKSELEMRKVHALMISRFKVM